MSTAIRLIAVLILGLVGGICPVACSEPAPKSTVEISCDEFRENNHISRVVEIEAGQTFQVSLCSNRSTGFQWSEDAAISDATVLEQKDHEFVNPEIGQPGAPGQEVWTFRARQAGTSTIYLEYRRPWESDEEAEWNCTLEVAVK